MFDFEEELKKLPKQPGVYIMHDERDAIIYVGKAVNLHNRVRSYFRKIVGRGPQIDRMVSQIARFEYIVTDSELEALVLENNLIKEHRPKYNTMLKDDKTYPYIKVTVQEPYPRILFSRQMKKDKARYFGPFTSAAAVRDSVELISRMYGLRDCSRRLPEDIGKERPCLNYHMKRCCGPCAAGNVTEEEYRGRIALALEFLSGNYAPVLKDLKDKMNKAAEEMAFEEAAHWRDLLQSVEKVSQKQKMSEGIGEDKDILGIAMETENADADAVIQTFFIRDGRMIGREHFYMTHVGGRSAGAVLSDFVKQFYAGTPFVPREILLPEAADDQEVLEEWLTLRKGSKVTLVVPQKGRKNKLVQLADENAALILSKDRERLRREEGRTIGAVHEIAQLIGMKRIHRMEAYDISNISGFANVGSMVVYENGRPKRSDYRKFRIKSVAGPDDYACMHEVLERRFLHGLKETENSSFSAFPDLILMDGGRGQVNVCLEVLDDLGLSIPVCGMVKDDHHRTRGLYFNNVEIPIDRHSEGFKLITRIQDEAHRFAIEYHRSLRSRAQVTSRLDEIPGVGPARKKALMREFASIRELSEATEEQIAQIPEISAAQAKVIYDFFHAEGGAQDA
ncbi:MAG: excinuclease ABC subunit UvrC [Lachnospiraceae bacterium]|nr:excinuclease ABC subunit UvrC [Lachnospiraceae bacterium]